MRQGRISVLAAVLLLAGMAGCIGGDDAPTDESLEDQSTDDLPAASEAPGSGEEAPAPTQEGADGAAEAASKQTEGTADRASDEAPDLEAYRFSHQPLDLTIVEEGTFGPDATCHAPESPTCQAMVKDLTSLLPATAPVQIVAEATYTTAAAARVDVELHAPTGTVYDQWYGFSQQGQEVGVSKITTSVHSTLVADGQQVLVEVTPRVPEPGQPLDVTLTIELSSPQTNLPTTIPIEVPIQDPHQPLRIERAPGASTDGEASDGGADVAALMIWDPADRFVGHETVQVPGTFELNTSMAGDHVLLLGPSSAEDLRLMGPSAGDQRLRALTHAFQRGPVHEVLPEQPANWSFEPERVPMSAGIFANGSQADAANANWEVRLSSPSGDLVDASRQTGELWFYPEDHTLYWFSSWADPDLVVGTYDAYAAGIYSGTAQVGEILVHYER